MSLRSNRAPKRQATTLIDERDIYILNQGFLNTPQNVDESQLFRLNDKALKEKKSS